MPSFIFISPFAVEENKVHKKKNLVSNTDQTLTTYDYHTKSKSQC